MTVDLTARIGSVTLPNPVMSASGLNGHSDEFAAYLNLADLGAFVVKSLLWEPWKGNPAPRLAEAGSGMLNSVGLPGPGVEAWLEHDLPKLETLGARVVPAIWGFTIDEYQKAASMLAPHASRFVALEVNIACPNTDNGKMFAQDPVSTKAAVEASAVGGLPLWVKLSPSVTSVPAIAAAAQDGGANAVVLTNTVLGMAIDVETRTYRNGAGGAGYSGSAIHPIVVRVIHDVRKAHPDLPIIGVGGIFSGIDAIEMMMAGANAVQIGTASFLDPRACARILKELQEWCESHNVASLDEVIGAIHVPNGR